MRHLKTKVIGFLLSLVMVITLIPAVASAREANRILYVGGKYLLDTGKWVDEELETEVSAPKGVSFQGTSEKGTLTLKNVTINEPSAEKRPAGIGSNVNDLTICLVGNNVIGNKTDYYAGIMSETTSSLTIEGSGSLAASGRTYGIGLMGDLTISGAKVTAKGNFFPLFTEGKFTARGEGTRVEAETAGYMTTAVETDAIRFDAAILAGDISYPGLLLTKPKNGTIGEFDTEYMLNESLKLKTIFDGEKPASHVIIEAPEKDPSGVIMAKLVAKKKNKLKLSWSALDGADGYDVFFAKCGEPPKYKRAAIISGGSKTTWTSKRLKRGKCYQAYVKAWFMKDGKKTYVSTSPKAHAFVGGGNRRFTNSKAVKLKESSATLTKGNTYRIRASVKKVKPYKRLIHKSHAPKLRYLCDNKDIATVSAKGVVTGKSAGTCMIYVYAPNGASKIFSLTVK